MTDMYENTRPTLIFDTEKPLIFDFNDPDPQLTMFDRLFAGCFTLRFSKPMDPGYGTVETGGRSVGCTVRPVWINGEESW